MTNIVDGKKIAKNLLTSLAKEVKKLKSKPVLAVVLVGNDKISATYVRKKQEAADSIGIVCQVHRFPEKITEQKLLKEIADIQKRSLSGIIIQLPLPKHLDKKVVLNAIHPEFDVDFLSWVSLGKLITGESVLMPPAPAAILEILKFHKVNLKGKHVVLVGQGDLIGKPLTNIMLKMPLTLSVCNKETKNLSAITKQADILITGVGKSNLIKAAMVKNGVIVIDAGTSYDLGKITGDVDFAKVASKSSLITPTPGGVGPITVAKLMENTVAIAKIRNK